MERALALIVAMANKGVIGAGGTLPWHIPEDLKRFKQLTMGHALIMGRTTHASIGKALPGRRNIVISSDPKAVAAGCEHVRTFGEALIAAYTTDEMPFVIGGAKVYAAALPIVTHVYETVIERDVPGDTYFPAFNHEEFEEVERVTGSAPDISFRKLVRRGWAVSSQPDSQARV